MNTAFASTSNTESASGWIAATASMMYKSKITINEKVSFMKNMIPTPTMSEILWEEFMEPMGISAYRLAKDIHVPVSRIQEILRNKRKVTVDTSLRLGKYFGVSDRYFIDLQNDIDIRNQKIDIQHELEKIEPCIA